MEIHRGYTGLNLGSPVVTVGIFDGVHRGHKSLIDVVRRRAIEKNSRSVLITFEPHPRIVLEKESQALRYLSTPEEKYELLGGLGLDDLVVIDFTREFSNTGACEFINNVICDAIGAQHLVLGHNHHFGFRGEGSFETITECAAARGLNVEQADEYTSGGEETSSTAIRKMIREGRVNDANIMLGYNYPLSGVVIKGKMLGRELGFPTANIAITDPHKLIPADGVYAVDTEVDGKHYKGMLSVGTNPTVNIEPSEKSVEVHIFDFDKDIYGCRIKIFFRFWLREERRFESVGHLVSQMELDRIEAISLLS
jgi:riboflavin kinase/FMN adenylyltransferase